jgi:formylglycine-generating enzyme required for sulfatase activity
MVNRFDRDLLVSTVKRPTNGNYQRVQAGTSKKVPYASPGKTNYIEADDRYAGLAPTGSYKANAFGVYDTHGNVWEFCIDMVGGKEEIVIKGGCFL